MDDDGGRMPPSGDDDPSFFSLFPAKLPQIQAGGSVIRYLPSVETPSYRISFRNQEIFSFLRRAVNPIALSITSC